MARQSLPRPFHNLTASRQPEISEKDKAFEADVVEKNETTDGSVGHAKVRIGDSILGCSEAHGEWGPRTATMHLNVKDVDAAYKRALESRATSLSEPKDQFYGERSGVTDRWGNNW